MTYLVRLPDGYEISDDAARLDVEAVHAFIAGDSYWGKGRARTDMVRAIAGSLCFGLYAPDGHQAGFARLVTDRALAAHLADVFVLPAHRGRGLSKALIAAMLAHPDLRGVERWTLSTADAHGLYARFGFGPHPDVTTQMWRLKRPDTPAPG
ncbi:MAG: GNAT family N-acetyltransferase [Rhodospirillales bacterium]|nr:GNAT family N-acetyltransferase [Rhodospirillales bacterium]